MRNLSIRLALTALFFAGAQATLAQAQAPAPAPGPGPAPASAPAAGPAPAPPAPGAARRTADAALVRTLQDHEWTLRSATSADGKPIDALLVPGKPFVLRFREGRVSIKGGCNTLNSRWRLSPQNALSFARAASTQMACEPALMAADAAMVKALEQPLQARAEKATGGAAATLYLVSGTQQTLSFEGRRTLTSQFGAPTRVFLEVAAQRVPCTPAMQPPTTCLQVREIRFDDKGLRVAPPGAWRAFYGEIAGYSHAPGTSNVLRLNRYTRPNPPADASAYVYELDLVVESRTEKT
jgi:heat shock protein HslJ